MHVQPILLTATSISAGCSTACVDCVLHTKHAAERILSGHSSDDIQKVPIECCGLASDDAVSVLPMMLCCCLLLDHGSTNNASQVGSVLDIIEHAGGKQASVFSKASRW